MRLAILCFLLMLSSYAYSAKNYTFSDGELKEFATKEVRHFEIYLPVTKSLPRNCPGPGEYKRGRLTTADMFEPGSYHDDIFEYQGCQYYFPDKPCGLHSDSAMTGKKLWLNSSSYPLPENSGGFNWGGCKYQAVATSSPEGFIFRPQEVTLAGYADASYPDLSSYFSYDDIYTKYFYYESVGALYKRGVLDDSENPTTFTTESGIELPVYRYKISPGDVQGATQRIVALLSDKESDYYNGWNFDEVMQPVDFNNNSFYNRRIGDYSRSIYDFRELSGCSSSGSDSCGNYNFTYILYDSDASFRLHYANARSVKMSSAQDYVSFLSSRTTSSYKTIIPGRVVTDYAIDCHGDGKQWVYDKRNCSNFCPDGLGGGKLISKGQICGCVDATFDFDTTSSPFFGLATVPHEMCFNGCLQEYKQHSLTWADGLSITLTGGDVHAACDDDEAIYVKHESLAALVDYRGWLLDADRQEVVDSVKPGLPSGTEIDESLSDDQLKRYAFCSFAMADRWVTSGCDPEFIEIILGPDTPDAGNPDASNPDSGNPDSGNPDSGNPDSGNPDSGNPDSGNPDSGNPDAGNPDSGNPDTGNPDSGNPDTGNPDTGNPDTGNPDPVSPTNCPSGQSYDPLFGCMPSGGNGGGGSDGGGGDGSDGGDSGDGGDGGDGGDSGDGGGNPGGGWPGSGGGNGDDDGFSWDPLFGYLDNWFGDASETVSSLFGDGIPDNFSDQLDSASDSAVEQYESSISSAISEGQLNDWTDGLIADVFKISPLSVVSPVECEPIDIPFVYVGFEHHLVIDCTAANYLKTILYYVFFFYAVNSLIHTGLRIREYK